MSQPHSSPSLDFVISRAGANSEAALVIDEILRGAGFATLIQDKDLGNQPFEQRTDAGARAVQAGARIVAVLSDDYLASQHCMVEAQHPLTDDPINERQRLIVLRIEDCTPLGALRTVAYVDLVPLLDDGDTLTRAVLGAVAPERDSHNAHIAALYRRAGRQILHTEIRPVPDFAGRAAELSAIDVALWGKSGAAAVHGPSGVGKSMLARQYAWDNHERYAGVWWVNASSRESVASELVSLGGRLIPGLDETPDHARAARLTLDTIAQMQTGMPWLLVYDDVANPAVLDNLTPPVGAHILITGRSEDWAGSATEVPVGPFARPLAMDYLLTRARKSDAAAAGRLSDDLGHLPLALGQARATAWVAGLDFDAYRTLLREAGAGTAGFTPVRATVELGLRQAVEHCPGAERLMGIAAHLAPDRMPLDIITADAMSPAERDAAVQAVVAVALAAHEALDDGSAGISVHPLVQAVVRERLAGRAAEHAGLATRLVAAAYPSGEGEHDPADVRSWPACERLEHHARAVLANPPQAGEAGKAAAALLGQLARHLQSRGDLDEAEPMIRRAVDVGRAVLGSDSALVASALADLASLLQTTGRTAEAEPLLREAVAISERGGADASSLASYLDDLGALLLASGRPEDGEGALRRALAVSEQGLGADHPEVATRLGALAQHLQATNRRTEAEPLMHRALEIAERRLGPSHPGTALRLRNLALLLRDNGQAGAAEPLLQRALSIDEVSHGPMHATVATDLGNLSSLLRDLGRPADALPLARRALEIDSTLLPPEHPVIARHYNNVAMILTDLGRSDDVAPYIHHAVLAAEKSLGIDHPDTRRYRANYERVMAMTEAKARQDDAVEAGRAPAPPERLARKDLPAPARTGVLRRILQNKRVWSEH